jgi:hypothetical protein
MKSSARPGPIRETFAGKWDTSSSSAAGPGYSSHQVTKTTSSTWTKKVFVLDHPHIPAKKAKRDFDDDDGHISPDQDYPDHWSAPSDVDPDELFADY